MSTPEPKKSGATTAPALTKKPAAQTRDWVKLSNFTRVRMDLVAAVSSKPDTGWIFLKNDKDEILCAVQHDNQDEFEAELTNIDEQLG